MSNKNYTHRAKIYGIPCYFNDEDMSVEGVNWICEKLIDIAIFLDNTFKLTDGFYITDLQELK